MEAKPPVAPRRPTRLVAHGDERVDHWYWLRQRDDPEVLAYLEAENAYAAAALAHTAGLQRRLFEEFRGRILETDLSVPARKGEYWYYTRTVEGLQYPIHARRRGGPEADEEIVLDENALAARHAFLQLGAFAVSPDHRLLAYSIDTDGDETYTLHVRELASGTDLGDRIANTSEEAEWADDNATLFYTVLDEAKRAWRLYRHVLGTEPGADELVHQEDDEAFHLALGKTRSEAFIVLTSQSRVTTEVRVLEANQPGGGLRLVQPRQPGMEYGLDHQGDRFFVVTNEGAENFKLVEAPTTDPGKANWREVVPHRPDVKLEAVDAFSHHLVLYERAAGSTRIAVRRSAGGDIDLIDQPESVSTVWGDENPEFDTATLRYRYTSLVTPVSVFDYDMDLRRRELKKQQPVLGGYDPADYETGRMWARAPDGEAVPISFVHRRGRGRDGAAPALLYGYGSYEESIDPCFSALRLSLLDRGFLFALAHVRGGGEMGRRWYEEGKLLGKQRTFTDFVACAEHLIAEGWTSPARLVIRGGSAGGLLVAAAANLRPELFRAVVAEVPFVDCLTTMLDETLPLTVTEREEWGDPNDLEVYRYLKSYSPYDNVEAKAYPVMLVTAGLNDPRVGYWEPAKWVAKLRATKTDANPLLLRTELGAGHGGPSGRYDAWREEALVYAFVLDAVGISS